MNWVSRHILLAPFMCLFLLLSCGSSHKAVKSDVEVISKDSASESVNIVHGSSTSLSELITTNGNYVIDFRIYDTRKPPDSLTGKPPLLADGHVEGDFSKNKRKETATKDSTEVKADKEATSTKHKLSSSQLSAAKKQIIGQIGVAGDNFENNALDMGKTFLHYGKFEGSEEVFKRIEMLTAEHLWDIANEMFDENYLSTLIYL